MTPKTNALTRLSNLFRRLFPLALGVCCCLVGKAQITPAAQSLPPTTAIPVQLTRTLEAGRAKPGDVVAVKTMQAVRLDGNLLIPSNTKITGHVVASRELTTGPVQNPEDKPSVLSLRFDTVTLGGSNQPIAVLLRACASTPSRATTPAPLATWTARTPSAPSRSSVTICSL